MYIQDKVEEYADEVFDLLDNGAHIYFCGLKGMMPGELPHCRSHVMYGAILWASWHLLVCISCKAYTIRPCWHALCITSSTALQPMAICVWSAD